MSTIKPIPEGYHSVTPYIICKGAAEAIEFYKKVFGAVEVMRLAGPNGQIGPCGNQDRRLAYHALGRTSGNGYIQPAALWRLARQRAYLR